MFNDSYELLLLFVLVFAAYRVGMWNQRSLDWNRRAGESAAAWADKLDHDRAVKPRRQDSSSAK